MEQEDTMSRDAGSGVWVNRVFAFLAGGLLVLAIMSFAVVSPVKTKNEALTKQLDEVQNGAARLLAEAKALVENKSYETALRTLATLLEKQPGSPEAAEGKMLSLQIQTAVREKDAKWEAAVAGVRTTWERSKAAELREKADKDRQQVDAGMTETLNSEWELAKEKVRQAWENGEV
jgi:hypothetical protein